jgi:multimeric flavodoxin WrbA
MNWKRKKEVHMKILILNGSPRPNGNTKALIDAFREGAFPKGMKLQKPTLPD